MAPDLAGAEWDLSRLAADDKEILQILTRRPASLGIRLKLRGSLTKAEVVAPGSSLTIVSAALEVKRAALG